MTYRMYSLVGDTVKQALADYQKKMGHPPQVLEVSQSFDKLPEGLTLVVKRERIPANIILFGSEEDDQA